MSIICTEKWIGRSADGTKAEVDWLIFGTDDEDDARSALLAAAPTSKNGLPRIDAQCSVTQTNATDFEGKVVYSTPGTGKSTPRETGDSTYEFDTTGGETQHVDFALDTVAAYGDGANVADNAKAIGLSQDGRDIEGVDVPTRAWDWAETHYIANSVVNNAYKQTLYNLSKTVNDAAFKGLLKGTTLFWGARGGQRGDEDWQITFQFKSKHNATLAARGDVPAIPVEGWQQVDYEYEPNKIWEGTRWARITMRAVRAYVHQVLPYGNFSGLGIGT